MEIVSLYDIHGNIDALQAVFGDRAASGADLVIIGGDAVPGPFAGATLALLDALDVPTRWLRGNGEREVAEAVDVSEPADDDLAMRTAAITARYLTLERYGLQHPLHERRIDVGHHDFRPENHSDLTARFVTDMGGDGLNRCLSR